MQRKKSDYNSKNTGHALVAGFVLAVLVQNSYILSMDSLHTKKVHFHAFRAVVAWTSPSSGCKKLILFE